MTEVSFYKGDNLEGRCGGEGNLLFRCVRSLDTRYACSSLTNCKLDDSSLISCSTGAMCSSSSVYRTPWTLKLELSARLFHLSIVDTPQAFGSIGRHRVVEAVGIPPRAAGLHGQGSGRLLVLSVEYFTSWVGGLPRVSLRLKSSESLRMLGGPVRAR